MKKIYIPNSLHFSAIPTGTDNFMSIFDITSKTHNYENMPDPRVSKANKYLRRMYRRLDKLAIATHPLRFTKVALILLKRSLAFRLAAVNFKWPKWFYKGTGTDAKELFRTVLKLGQSLATAIDYKRVWIPKGNKPYMRPIGSPKVPWRCYLWEWYFITDVWISHNNGRAAWQHGGFSRKGPNTFFEQLINEERHKKPFIYEFDLKGYFNNITHKSMLDALKSVNTPLLILNHMKEALVSKPTEYKLPPVEQDLAIKVYQETEEKYNTIRRLVESVRAEYYEALDSGGKIIWGSSSRMPNLRALRKWSVRYAQVINEIAYLESNLGTDRYIYDGPRHLVKQLKVLAQIQTGNLFKFIDYPIDLMNKYSDIMNTNTITKVKGLNIITKPYTKEDQALGRDKWANLGHPDKGTPQGVSYSPLLTSVTSSINFGLNNTNLMMYMDDGIITANSRLELEQAIQTFKKGAESMGVELASDKSGMIKEDGVWLKDLKIIGFRIDPWMDWVFSKTRSGTEVPMPRPDYQALKEYYAGKEELLKSQITSFVESTRQTRREYDMNPGTPRVTPDPDEFNKWLVKEIDRVGLDEFIDSGMKELGSKPTHELMVLEGKSGKALSQIWNPNQGNVRDKINEGLTKTVNKIKANKRSWLANHISDHRLESLGAGGYIQESISSLSTEMSRSVFEWDSRLTQKKVQSNDKTTIEGKTIKGRKVIRGATIAIHNSSTEPRRIYLYDSDNRRVI